MGGWLRSQMGGNGVLTERLIDELAESVYRCTACRRCTLECPMGVDHGLLTHLARYILSEIGVVPKALQVSVREQLHGKTHNTSAVPVPGLLDNLEFLEEELEEMKGLRVKFPVDKPDVKYVFFPAVSDYLMEADTLMGNAAVLHAAGDGDNWTIGTQFFDGINYGLFYSDRVLEHVIRRLVAEVKRLRGQVILIGECGHAARSAKSYVPQFADGEYPVMSFLEYTAQAIRDGRISLDPHAVTERVTYHDPCNIARSDWLVDQPRQILKAFVGDFVEMTPRGRLNYCCGGGGGTVSIDETHEYRMKIAGKVKADQIRKTGAQIVATPCANCKKQLRELVDYYELPVQVVGVHDLVLRAIRLHPGGNTDGNGRGKAAVSPQSGSEGGNL
jgi:Fe-S oxidoreductase